MNQTKSLAMPLIYFFFMLSNLFASQYVTLCEGNFGQANASIWSLNDEITAVEGPHIWDAVTNPMGDVGQSLCLYDHTLYAIMNGSHEVRVMDLEEGYTQLEDIDLPGSSPRYMAIHRASETAFVSSWTLGALFKLDLTTHTITDTIFIGALPEQILIHDDEMFVSIPLASDWSGYNKVLRYDLNSTEPDLVHSYDVIEGPGSMVIAGENLYVSSIYYNDAWETFSATSRINLDDHTVLSKDHGAYPNFTADINLINGVPYRTFGSSIVPFNQDLSLNDAESIGDIPSIYSFSVLNNKIVLGSTDFMAPDLIDVYDFSGQHLGQFNVGALPCDVVYYDPTVVSLDESPETPGNFTLGHNFPNPFNPSTEIPFSLNVESHISATIYDLQGRVVSVLSSSTMEAGNHSLIWQGTDDDDRSVSSGIYILVLNSGKEQHEMRLTLLK